MAKTILVADENPKIRKLLCELFESEQDYDICAEATNGQEAIDLASGCRRHLIILDLLMPVMDGLTAARELKRLMPDVPIILFTQCADLGRHMPGSNLPAECVVSRSETKELMTHVRSLIPVSISMKFRALRSQYSQRVPRILKLAAFLRGYLTIQRYPLRHRFFSLIDAFDELVEVCFQDRASIERSPFTSG